MTDEALKPCPFCGGSVTIDDCGEGDLFVFLCQEGSSCIGSGFANYGLRSKKAKAITAWNTRAGDGDKAKLREQGQQEGFAAAVLQLREMAAKKPRPHLAVPASYLAEILEQSRIPNTALQETAKPLHIPTTRKETGRFLT